MDPHLVVENERFPLEGGEEAYKKLRNIAPNINVSKTLDPASISYPIVDLFRHSCLLPLLALACPFHSDMLYEFYTNFLTPIDHSRFTSRIFFINIEFTKEELCHYLQISMEGPSAHLFAHNSRSKWTAVNRVLRNSNLHSHSQIVDELQRDPRVVQHVLRHSILAKAGDRPKITPLLSIVTYYVMEGLSFDVPDLLIRYMTNISETREPTSSRQINLALGHIIAHLIKAKYDLESPTTPDILPDYFSNRSFVQFYKKEIKKRKGPIFEVEEEEEKMRVHVTQGEASESGTHHDSLEDRMTRLELRSEEHIHESRENWAWIKG